MILIYNISIIIMKVCTVTVEKPERNFTNICNMPVMAGLQYCRKHITLEKDEDKRCLIDISALVKQKVEDKKTDKPKEEKKTKQKKGKTLSYSDEDSDVELSDYHPEIKTNKQNNSSFNASKKKKKYASSDEDNNSHKKGKIEKKKKKYVSSDEDNNSHKKGKIEKKTPYPNIITDNKKKLKTFDATTDNKKKLKTSDITTDNKKKLKTSDITTKMNISVKKTDTINSSMIPSDTRKTHIETSDDEVDDNIIVQDIQIVTSDDEDNKHSKPKKILPFGSDIELDDDKKITSYDSEINKEWHSATEIELDDLPILINSDDEKKCEDDIDNEKIQVVSDGEDEIKTDSTYCLTIDDDIDTPGSLLNVCGLVLTNITNYKYTETNEEKKTKYVKLVNELYNKIWAIKDNIKEPLNEFNDIIMEMQKSNEYEEILKKKITYICYYKGISPKKLIDNVLLTIKRHIT